MVKRKTKKSKKGVVKIHVPLGGNEYLEKAIEKIQENQEINTIWEVINVNALDRLNMSDHGPVHFQIVANIALRLARILNKNKIKLSLEEDYQLDYQLAELVIFYASVMHDLGMSVERDGHEAYSLFLANHLLYELIDYLPVREKTIVISEVLHAIISHRRNGQPLTIEAGIVRVADALDMSEGRSRIPYEAGIFDIYAVSAAAIDKIEISEGKKTPILVNIVMNNSAGVFQIDELLKKKIKGSGLEDFIAVKAYIGRKREKKLLKEFSI